MPGSGSRNAPIGWPLFAHISPLGLENHEFFGAIGYFYDDFRQVADEEVIAMLAQFPIRALVAKPETWKSA